MCEWDERQFNFPLDTIDRIKSDIAEVINDFVTDYDEYLQLKDQIEELIDRAVRVMEREHEDKEQTR